jgi:hypothetical protein
MSGSTFVRLDLWQMIPVVVPSAPAPHDTDPIEKLGYFLFSLGLPAKKVHRRLRSSFTRAFASKPRTRASTRCTTIAASDAVYVLFGVV